MFITTCQHREGKKGKEINEETNNVVVSLQLFISTYKSIFLINAINFVFLD